MDGKIKHRANEQCGDQIEVDIQYLIRLSLEQRINLGLQLPTSSQEHEMIARYTNNLLNDITYLMRKRDTLTEQ